MDPLSYIFSLLPGRVAVPVLAAVGLCAVLDAVLPQPKAGSAWMVPRRILTMIGANWLYARNLLRPGTGTIGAIAREPAPTLPSSTPAPVVVSVLPAAVPPAGPPVAGR